jgi:transposase
VRFLGKPVWHVLAGSCALVLANATAVRNVPGRKSDVSDAAWLADLLAHGLIRPSFVPDAPTQELRGLTRTRTQLVREHTRHAQRVHKVLEDANLKLATVLSDVFGSAGRAVLAALVAGETDPARLAALVTTRVRAAPAALTEALRGTLTDYHRFEYACTSS